MLDRPSSVIDARSKVNLKHELKCNLTVWEWRGRGALHRGALIAAAERFFDQGQAGE